MIIIIDDYIKTKCLRMRDFILFNFSIALICQMGKIISLGIPGKSDIANSTIRFTAINILYYNFTISIYPETSIWYVSELQIKSLLIAYTMPRT